MRPVLLTPLRLLSGIAAFTILCMFAVAVVTDHLADVYLTHSAFVPSSRVHLINDVTQALKRAQDSRRAYLATGDVAYLTAYREASSDVDVTMDRLVTQDHEVANKLAHAEDLRGFVHAKLSQIEKSLESSPAAKTPGGLPLVDSGLARIQKLMDSLAQDESRDISGGLENARAQADFHRNLMITLAVINILFLGGVAFCAMQISRLYSLITMCAWSKRVQFGDKWVPLEEYMRKRFGLRISHGISQEEYAKWAMSEMDEALTPEQPAAASSPLPAETHAPKAAV